MGEVDMYDNKTYDKIVVIPPDGYGSRGDEAMVRGLLNMFSPNVDVTLLTPRKEIWKECILEKSISFKEKVVPLADLKEHIKESCLLIIIGADVMDGIFGEDQTLFRLEAAEVNGKLGGHSIVNSCSFRSDASTRVVEKIKQLGDDITFYLRDYESLMHYERLTRRKGYFFPDLAFNCEINETERAKLVTTEIEKKRYEGKNIVGVNLCEHAFQSKFEEHNNENRKKYVYDLMDCLLDNMNNVYIVLVAHDMRFWENHFSDKMYLDIAKEYIQEKDAIDNIYMTSEFYSEPEIIAILSHMDFVISGRMHLDIATMRAGSIPIAYNANNGSFKEIEKFYGMYSLCYGNTDLIAINQEELILLIQKLANKENRLALLNKYTEFAEMVRGYFRKYNKSNENRYMDSALEMVEYFVEKDRLIRRLEKDKRDLQGNLEWEIEEKEKKQRQIEDKQKVIEEQTKRYAHDINSKNIAIKIKEGEIEQQRETINNQRGHIEQLLEVDRHYQNIVRSKGWRLVSFPGRVFEKLYPVGTPRRRRISNVVKYVKAVNITNIKFVANAFRKGGMKQVRKEMNAFKYRCNNELPSVEPQIWEVDEITDLSQCDKLVFKKWDAPKVSIVIPVYNQFTYTYNCLKSILENSGDVSYEIIIADDVSNDLTTRLSEIAENIQIARNKENQRFLRNCNQAAKYARGEYILFLNNDTQVQENWLQPLVELIERDDSIGMVGSKLIYPDGSLQEAGGIIWRDGHAWNYGNGQNANKPEFNYVKEVDYVSGAAIMIRSSLWKEIGGFDELFAPAYCEDSDLAFEVRKHGYKLMYQPASVVVHFEGKSNGTDLNAGVKSYQVENSKKLAEKWKEEFARQSQTEDDLFHARERSQNKKTILVIDHYVPQFDKDAGSKTTWQYLKMFVKQGYNVKFMGDNFFQDEEYTPVLEQYGIEVLYGPWYAENYKQWIIDNQDNIDFVYLNRPHITEKYIDFIKNETNIKCIYYGHDLHFLRIFREYELCKDEALLQESEDWKRREFAIMKQADINYYPSYVEVDEIHKVDSSIPAKAITAYVYEEFRDDISLDFAQKNGILFVGGFGHPPNEDAVLWFAKNVYPLITKKQDIPFYIVGSNATDAVKRLNSKNIIVKGFVTEEELKELYDNCKLVVVPLRYGAGVKGKVVEALYYGTPMVTTTVGIEGIKGAEEFMEVADEPEEFAQKVLTLYNDNDRLVKTVEDYQKYIKAHNSIDAVWDIVKEDFQ